MAVKLEIGIAVVALGALGLLLWQFDTDGGPSASPRTRAVAPPAVDAADLRSPDPLGGAPAGDERAGRVPLGARTRGDIELPDARWGPSYAYSLKGVVVDEDDAPLAGIAVHLGPLLHPLNHAGHTDEHGSFHVRWWGRAPSMEIALVRSADIR